jgi:hypothetical protein
VKLKSAMTSIPQKGDFFAFKTNNDHSPGKLRRVG